MVQRVRVGMTGLALVLVLIAAGSAVFRSAGDTQSVATVGSSKSDVVANMTVTGNTVDTADTGKKTDEPLAELGAAPGASAMEPIGTNKIASQISAEQQKDSSKVH